MLTSDEKTLLPSLLSYTKSDLFTCTNISSPVTLQIDIDDVTKKWDVIATYLPMEFARMIESKTDIYTLEKFDKKYLMNPKLCAYDRYGITNMWRPLMILNKCPTIMDFNFDYIRYFDMGKFQQLMSVLISRYNV
jgi:hypothetical protein